MSQLSKRKRPDKLTLIERQRIAKRFFFIMTIKLIGKYKPATTGAKAIVKLNGRRVAFADNVTYKSYLSKV